MGFPFRKVISYFLVTAHVYSITTPVFAADQITEMDAEQLAPQQFSRKRGREEDARTELPAPKKVAREKTTSAIPDSFPTTIEEAGHIGQTEEREAGPDLAGNLLQHIQSMEASATTSLDDVLYSDALEKKLISAPTFFYFPDFNPPSHTPQLMQGARRGQIGALIDLPKALEDLRVQGLSGDLDAVYQLGVEFEKGEETEANRDLAGHCYYHGMLKGHPECSYKFALLLKFGSDSFAVDHVQSTKILKALATNKDLKHANACRDYADCLQHGVGTEVNFGVAGQYYKKALTLSEENGVPDILAKMALSDIEKKGIPITDDLYGDFEKDLSCAIKGSKKAKISLAKRYYYGIGCNRNIEEALRMFEEASQAREHDASYFLGKLFLEGKHVQKDLLKAQLYFQRDALSSHKGCCYELAKLYLEGPNGIRKNAPKAIKLLKKAASCTSVDTNDGILEAQLLYWDTVKDDKRFSKEIPDAVASLTCAARRKSPQACLEMARIYEKGIEGVVEPNMRLSYLVIRDVAESVFFETFLKRRMYQRLASHCLSGKGTEQNFFRARTYLEKSLEAEPTPWAHIRYANLLSEGKGGAADVDLALIHLKEAFSEKDARLKYANLLYTSKKTLSGETLLPFVVEEDPFACTLYGRALYDGYDQSITENYAKLSDKKRLQLAYKYLRIGAKNNNPIALYYLSKMLYSPEPIPGVPHDQEKALKYLKKAWKEGKHEHSLIAYGVAIKDDPKLVTPEDYYEAFSVLLRDGRTTANPSTLKLYVDGMSRAYSMNYLPQELNKDSLVGELLNAAATSVQLVQKKLELFKQKERLTSKERAIYESVAGIQSYCIKFLKKMVELNGTPSTLFIYFWALNSANPTVLPDEAFTALQSAASAGHVKAQHFLGTFYLNGFKGVPKKTDLGITWLYEAAKTFGPSCHQLAAYYYNQKKYDSALAYLNKGVELKHTSCKFMLGRFLYENRDGLFQFEQQQRGVALLKELCKENHDSALYILGRGLLYGDPIFRNQAEGLKLIQAGASKGNLACQVILAVNIYHGKGIEKNPKKGIQLLSTLMNKGYTPAKVALGKLLLSNSNPQYKQKGASLIKEAMKAGSPEAAAIHVNTLIKQIIYGHGRGYSVAAREQIAKVSKGAAEAGSAEGYVALGHCYYYGIGVPVNKIMAYQAYSNASKINLDSGNYYVAKMLYEGSGIDQNIVLAKLLIQRTDLSSHLPSKYLYAKILLETAETEEDRELGTTYLTEAANANCEDAAYTLAKCFEKLGDLSGYTTYLKKACWAPDNKKAIIEYATRQPLCSELRRFIEDLVLKSRPHALQALEIIHTRAEIVQSAQN